MDLERFSHYQIQKKLGSGGMGEVYLAHDTMLDRAVAIKILPSQFVLDHDRLRRFLREARAASAINHPNVAHIYEIGETSGMHFIAMEYVHGETLADVLQRSALSPPDLARVAIEIVDALQEAHARGIIHRDIKPSNVMMSSRGQVKLLDFGLAKVTAADDAGSQLSTASETELGRVLGTLPYMSPEQLLGHKVDQRSDIFSLGAVLYQLGTGQFPFSGKTQIEIADAILHQIPPRVDHVNKEIPVALAHIIEKMMARNPEDRYQTASELLSVLHNTTRAKPGMTFRKPAVFGSLFFLVLLIGSMAWVHYRNSKIRWARNEAIPRILQLVDDSKYSEAVSLATQASEYIPDDPVLQRIWPTISSTVSIETIPGGADIFLKEYKATDANWRRVGTSPLRKLRIAKGYFRWQISKPGYASVVRVAPKYFYETEVSMRISLLPEKSIPSGMVAIPGGNFTFNVPGLTSSISEIKIPDFWMDRYEVSNKDFKKFVDAAGYRNRSYWKIPFARAGKQISWEEGISTFHDAAGRPGPRNWEVGNYPNGQADYPVTGVSWYEAAAYAEFAGKRLPTVHHWVYASGVPMGVEIVPMSNFTGKGFRANGDPRSMSPFGTINMAGNVKEWCWNETSDSKRFILGGAFNEPEYLFHQPDQRSPFDRESNFGFRCMKPALNSPVPSDFFAAIPEIRRDYTKEKPVPDEVFTVLKTFYSYVPGELKSQLESKNEEDYWTKETVTFEAPYGNERIIAHLFLPKNARPPYQTVIFFPGAWAQTHVSSQHIETDIDYQAYLDFLVRSGRAAVYPIYKGTFERGGGQWVNLDIDQYRDWTFQVIKDVKRTVDYLQTRKDVDQQKLAYYGYSWGARLGSIVGAVEPRFRTLILAHAGFGYSIKSPAVDEINFVSRVTIPVLMINGRYDHIFPVEAAQNPFFNLLGTDKNDKQHLIFNGGHSAPRNEVIKAVLDWLDHYLGPVSH